MFKKSIVIILIQLAGSLLGLVSLYFIAGDMAPEVYSLVGVYNIVVSVVLTFSDLGIETTMMRETLYWIENKEEKKVSEYATQALLSRMFAFFVILPFLIFYMNYLNFNKYDGRYTVLLCTFIIGGGISALNNAMSLVIRSHGEYVFSQFAVTLNNYVIKFLGLGLYFKLGEDVYLYFYALSSIPLLLVYFIKIHKLFSWNHVDFKQMLKKVYSARYLWLKTDLDYLKNNADSILVSAIFPASIMGSYSIFKTFELLSKTFIEGFFDVQSQHTVRFKGNKKLLIEQERKIKRARNYILVLIALGTVLYAANTGFWINLVRLNRYQEIEILIYGVIAITFIHVVGKYEINALAFFATSKLNFLLGIGIFMGTIFSFGIVIFNKSIASVMIQRIAVYLLHTLLAIYLFNSKKESLYTNVER